MPQSDDLMEKTLTRAFVDEAVEGLFGAGPERAASAYRSFRAQGTHPGVIVECPLLGPAGYDVSVGSYGNLLVGDARLPQTTPPVCHAAFDWAASLDRSRGIDLFFEMDADGPEGRPTGIHCRHWGDLAAAAEFFEAIGEGWRSRHYRAVSERLPRGWAPVFAAAFTGRPGAPTRLELALSDEARAAIGDDPAHLRECFDQMGFSAYDGKMLEDASRLAAASRMGMLQFDIRADGTLGETFSIVSCYERTGADFPRLFLDDGVIGCTCGIYEQMGFADGRWHLAEGAVFATKSSVWDDSGMHRVVTVSLPNCGKARWTGATPQPAKLYLLLAATARWGRW